MATVSSNYTELASPVQALLNARASAAKVASDGVVRATTSDTTVSATDSPVQQALKSRNAAKAKTASDYTPPAIDTTLSDNDSPIVRAEKLAAIKKQAQTKTQSDNQVNFLRMKAFEISKRITLYKNLGLTAEYTQAQAEGVDVVKKYQAILKNQLSGGSSSSSTSTTA
ncbi:MAG: hypothetical protein H6865_08585 [Rhodospirillales bacterium]|nr:hypothetical protein [Alphaproteobacteria bacterium]MCB9987672.1 hypothetical protein [Rhodospirillales bacterium]USO08027.1 MAG: hypothetical protein H6866_02080 [Rhodospirillales bacterium]